MSGNDDKAPSLLSCPDTTPRDRRNQLRIAGGCLAWAVLYVGSMLLIKQELLPAGPIRWAVAALPSVAAVFLLAAYARFLREADELQRLIQLQALALGFGGGYFAITGYQLFERLGAPEANGDIAIVMPFLYVVGLLIGWKRYQ
jgi:drug/metabolite transporter (DMT)-like permease